jgi:CTP:molybdopterin cytidylyltransferase MocA
MRVAGVLLAAGEGSRFGRPKALVELGGMTLAERGVALLRAGGADPVLVVTGAADVRVDDAHVVRNPDWRTGMASSLRAALDVLDSGDVDEGTAAEEPTVGGGLVQGGAIGSGGPAQGEAIGGGGPVQGGPAQGGAIGGSGAVAGGSGDWAGVVAAVVALADQPLVGAEAVRRLIGAYRAGATVAVAAYAGRPRNPVLIAREHWAEVIATATGDTGARAFLRARPELVTLVECGDTGQPDDIDTPEDLARIVPRVRPSGKATDIGNATSK